MEKRVYDFTEGNRDMKALLGGKGANLAEMTNLGLSIPQGFTITTKTCNEFMAADGHFPEGLWDEILEHVLTLEETSGKKFNDPENPLLASVRSGAPISMPGMMDTVLNLGINDEVAETIIKLTGDERFVWDAYRRFLTMFSDVVMGQDRHAFEGVFDKVKEGEGVTGDTDVSVDGLKETVAGMKYLYKELIGEEFPQDPMDQLKASIAAVFNSWDIPRARTYRKFEGIPNSMGTACNVQTMVFGNMGWDSGSGVMFTRSPSDGSKGLFGELLFNAQGEDVVAGIRTPIHISELHEQQPVLYKELEDIAETVEEHYKDMQDMEFTIEKGKLWILQTRTGKRTAKSAIKIAVDMADEGLIDKETAILRITPNNVDQLLHPQFDPEGKAAATFLAKGLNASPGAAVGYAIFNADRAEERGKAGDPVILVRPETTPDDVNGMIVSQGFLTQHGGGTSHAAVVARGWGKPCVAGCESIRIDTNRNQFTVGEHTIKEGDWISVDGATGEVFLGQVPKIETAFEKEKELIKALDWADEIRKIGVLTNADTPEDSIKARQFGAKGIGLCRTEHMFFDQEDEEISRRENVVKMILKSEVAAPLLRQIYALETKERTPEEETELSELKKKAENEDVKEYQESLANLLPFQRKDFLGIFEAMDGYPVIIRLIDPPMHEFLPPREELLIEVTELRCTGRDPEELKKKEYLLQVVESLWETNPMLGLRGCRAGLMYPGLTEMQVQAIMEAAVEVKKAGVDVHPEIMIPLTSHVNEMHAEHDKLKKVAEKVLREAGMDNLAYKIGTMIEIPRAALTADEIAESAEFFSFGTNDLTQMTFGISRDDAEGKFLLNFVDRGLLPSNPFQVIDREGVGQLMKLCVDKGRSTRPDLEIGICGEHGGEPSSIEFCHMIGLNYVSCSPYRVPIARLAAAHAQLNHPKN
ncbi:pyruvate, phosphate dikinase [Candidatus Bathyarchaeota archaeon]|nr:pyruvate, phosphate dikinase [Candidatus Bathyarchaeota archaeon]MBT4320793.1 pyruvate, phosphate dikinase [Candidatus Bathyarchaeota archaeon]MBT4423067.1 pyruvate, phosphate dikinase [Candidatus Bathyarchaeota archaeon]MBT6605663.1 pyruvate, phosphate dikinase [Candidatus Bathyarchaeota archaeon]MBT7186187.1 pyruvate, phosphate dikinase [Candidatus Bathyarchaeota archaeon]